MLKKEDIDLTLLDIRHQGINGIEVLKTIRENYSFVGSIIVWTVNEVKVAA